MRRTRLLLSSLLVWCSLSAVQATLYRINAGGSDFIDDKGNFWEGDKNQKYYTNGNAYTKTTPIANTVNDALYQTEIWKASKWEFPVPSPGEYRVRLHLAEVYGLVTGQRVYDVMAEGLLEKDDVDIYKLAGANTAWVETFDVTVNDGSLTIEFVKGKQEPKVCAIEIDVVPFDLYINAGSGDYVDSDGNTWVADTYFTGGKVFILQRSQSIAGTVEDPLYKTERYGRMQYDIPVPFNGDYSVKLHFAETYLATQSIGKRIFDIEIENKLARSQLDIFASVGSATALIESFETKVTDGTLSIKFIPSKENPKVNAIEIHSTLASGGSPTAPAPSPAPTTAPPTTPKPTTVPPTTAPPTTSKPTTVPPTIVLPTTVPPTTAKPTTVPPTTAPPTTSKPTTVPPTIVLPTTVPPTTPKPTTVPPTTAPPTTSKSTTAKPTTVPPTTAPPTTSKPTTVPPTIVPPTTVPPTTATPTTSKPTTVPPTIVLPTTAKPTTVPPTTAPPTTSKPTIMSPISSPTFGGGSTVVYRVNAGGSSYTDTLGQVWEADNRYVSFGRSFTVTGAAIAGTDDDVLFRSERWDHPSDDPMRFDFQVENGLYQVRLGFAEIYGLKAGERVFDVIINDQVVIKLHDIFSKVGANTADIEEFTTEVTRGRLTVTFKHVKENPKINCIEIHSLSGSPKTTKIYQINAGSKTDYVDGLNEIWEADTDYVTGGVTYSTGATVDTSAPGTGAQSIYQTERYRADMAYKLPVENGLYDVVLHMAETYSSVAQPGKRVFDILLEGDIVLNDFDITKAVGSFKATTRSFTVDVQDGELNITFKQKVENPKINAIQVFSLPGEPSPVGTAPPVSSPTVGGSTEVLYRINACGGQFWDAQGRTWEASDAYLQNGLRFGPVSTSIAGTVDDALFQTECYDPPTGEAMTFQFPIGNGSYEVRLGFSEVYGLVTGQRLFNVLIEDKVVLEEHDIFAAVGANAANIEVVYTEVTDGVLTVEFEHVVENPKINCIEVYSIGAVSPVPTLTPSPSPPLAPILPPTPPPAPSPTPPLNPPIPTSFKPIYINVGSNVPVTDPSTGITWEPDNFFNTGLSNTNTKSIGGTSFPKLYNSERYDKFEYPPMIYNISIPDGIFEIKLHFVDTFIKTSGGRVFDVFVEGQLALDKLDIVATVGQNKALIKTITTTCNDGFLEIEFRHVVENPTLNGIEIKSIGTVKPHYAHAVPGGPYFATDTDLSGSATIAVDGFYSHTHAAGASLVSFEWKADDVVVANKEQANITLDVGEHVISLKVVDSTGDVSEDIATATVRPFGFPYIASLTPNSGEMIGGEMVMILGSGFSESAGDTVIEFGSAALTGSQINIIDSNTIQVLAVPPASWGKVSVTVKTSVGTSNPVEYEYVPAVPVKFKQGNLLTNIFGPTTLAFSKEGHLYVGTQGGEIVKVALDEKYNIIGEILVSDAIPQSEPSSPYRAILGIALDPMDPCLPPDGCKVYVSHSYLFHGDIVNYNGKVSAISGENLSIVEDVVTGLPVSDHDHGVNGLEFNDHGDLFIQVGGNTNAGVPGPLSQSYLQKENYLSAATLIARGVTSNSFDGTIKYDVNGNMIAGFDVQVYAAGLRNPFDLVLHSNGRLYGTDNGPNLKFGGKSLSCTEDGPEPFHKDKLVLLEEGSFYGHANRKRGETDPRQCIWRDFYEKSEGYTGPIRKLQSSTNGICEFQSDHFGGTLRGQLILARYKGQLYNVKLTNGGKGAGEMDEFPNVLANEGGLDVTQGPDGTLWVARNDGGTVFYQAPDEEATDLLKVKSVFPRRGPESGGGLLTIYGQKLFGPGGIPTVSVGGIPSTVNSTKTYTDVNGREAQWVKVILPSGMGTVDVTVSYNDTSSTFSGGYRYITGQPSLLGIGNIYLVGADRDTDISLLQDCNGCIGPSTKVNIRVETVNTVGSVSLTLSGPTNEQKYDNVAPFTLFGENSGNYDGQTLPSGTYMFTVQAFTGLLGGGEAGPTKTLSFTVGAARRLRNRMNEV